MAPNQKQEVELLIKAGTEGLKSIGQLVKELEALGEDTGEASKQLEGLAGSLKGLRDQQKLVKQFADLKGETRDLAQQQDQAKTRATELGKALAQTEKPTKAQRTEFEKARKAAKAADQAWESNQVELNQLRDSLTDAGISTSNLSDEQLRIKREIAGVDEEISSVTSELTQMRDSARQAAAGSKKLGDDVAESGKRLGTFRDRIKGLGPVLGTIGSGLKTAAIAVTGFAATVGASVATMTLFSRSQGEAARNIRNTSDAIDISAQKLQEFQLAGKEFNIEGEKTSDILKDVTEKIGDFSATGGGEAADVFEQLNLSIEDFRNLSPDQQILKLSEAITQLDSRSEQVFFLESLASDASLLLPLLDDNAAALRRISQEAQASGAILSDKELDDLTRANDIYNDIDLKLKGLVNRIGVELAPVVAKSTDRVLKLFNTSGGADKLIGVFQRLTSSATDFFESLVKNQSSIGSGFQALVDTVQFLGNGITAVFRTVQTAGGVAVTFVAATLANFLTVAAKVTEGLNKIGVVSDEAYTTLRIKADAANATVNALVEQTAEYGRKAQQAGKDAANAFDNSAKAAKKTGEEIDDTVATLKPLPEALRKTGDEASSTLEKQAVSAERSKKALEEMGLEAGRALSGISQDAKESVAGLSNVADRINSLGATSKQSAEILRNGISSALEDISTAEEFDLIETKVRELFAEDKIDSRALEQALAKIKERQKEIATGTDSVNDSATDAGKEVDKLAEKTKAAGDQAKDAGNKSQGAFDGFGAVISNARQSVSALSDAARTLFEQRFLGNDFTPSMDSAQQRLDAVNQEVARLDSSARRLRNNTFADYFTNVALQAARVKQEFYEQAVAAEQLQESVESGAFSLEQLANISERSADKFNLLDDQRLSGLQSAIDAARSKLESLNSSAESTLNSLSQRLADIQGDTEEAQRLQYEAERKRLQEQLEQARQAGADNAAADYARALEQLEKINKIEQQNRREEENERERAAADRQRQQEQAERERQREERERSTTTNRQQSQASSPRQTIVLQTPSGGQTEVETSDPDGFLSVLEQAGLRSAQ